MRSSLTGGTFRLAPQIPVTPIVPNMTSNNEPKPVTDLDLLALGRKALFIVVGAVLVVTPVVAVFAALDLLSGDLEGMPAYFGWSVVAFSAYFVAKRLLRRGSPRVRPFDSLVDHTDR